MIDKEELCRAGWEEVPDPDDEIWRPEVKGDEITGIYLEKEEDVGIHHTNLYTLQREDGDCVGVFGTVGLDRKMKEVPIGWLVKIVFEGTRPSKPPRKPFKVFRVFKKPIEEGGDDVEKTPFQMNPHDDPEARKAIQEITDILIGENKPPQSDRDIMERAKQMHIDNKESMPKEMLKRIGDQLKRKN